MEYSIDRIQGGLCVSISGDIDHHGAEPMRAAVEQAIERENPRLLVLDFSGVEFMDSSGFGFIMGRYKTMARRGGSVAVTGCRDRIRRLLSISGADRYVKIIKKGEEK